MVLVKSQRSQSCAVGYSVLTVFKALANCQYTDFVNHQFVAVRSQSPTTNLDRHYIKSALWVFALCYCDR